MMRAPDAPTSPQCPVCGGGEAISLNDRPFRIAAEFRLHDLVFRNALCADCGLGYLYPRPDAAILEELYREGYRPHDELFAPIDLANIQRQRERFFLLDRNVQTLTRGGKPVFFEGCRVLDIGCYSGEILHALREKYGCDVVGIEFDEPVIEYARQVNKLDLRRVADPLEVGAALAGESFDVVVMVHSLEHIVNLREFLGMLRDRALRAGGSLVFEVPDLLGSPSYDITHVNHFCEPALGHVMARCGFELRGSLVAHGSGRNASSGTSLYAVAVPSGNARSEPPDVRAIRRARHRYARTARIRRGYRVLRSAGAWARRRFGR